MDKYIKQDEEGAIQDDLETNDTIGGNAFSFYVRNVLM